MSLGNCIHNGTKWVNSKSQWITIPEALNPIRKHYNWRFSTKHENMDMGHPWVFSVLLMKVISYLFKFLDLSLFEHGEHIGRGPLSTFCTSFLLLCLPAGLKHSKRNLFHWFFLCRKIYLKYTNHLQNSFYHLLPTMMLLYKRSCQIMVENLSLNTAAAGERERLRMSH